jgi:hypothetical protein
MFYSKKERMEHYGFVTMYAMYVVCKLLELAGAGLNERSEGYANIHTYIYTKRDFHD